MLDRKLIGYTSQELYLQVLTWLELPLTELSLQRYRDVGSHTTTKVTIAKLF